jgi:hypothetical protein
MHQAQDPHDSDCTSTAFWRNLAVVWIPGHCNGDSEMIVMGIPK